MRENRTFGLVWAVFFALVGAASLRHRHTPRVWAFGVSVGFLVSAALFPRVLQPLESAWALLGRALHRVMTPVACAGAFYLAFTPAGLLMRLFRGNKMRLGYDPAAGTYWIPRGDRETRWGVF